MKTYAWLVLFGFFSAVSSEAANIYWVSFHSADNTPSANAAAAGFTNAPDVGYTQLLRSHGHTVTRIVTSGTPDTNLLNAADLVIVSRSVPSGDYQDPPETLAWNGITAPTIILGGYIIRQNRLGYMAGSTIPDTAGPVRLRALLPHHPIFAGISLDASGLMVNPYSHIATFTNAPQRGISVVTGATAGAGEVLATVGTSGDPAAGGLVIGEWMAGSTMSVAGADKLGGHRLVILTGSREANGFTAEGAGIYDLENDGAQLLLNAVNYMTSGRLAIRQVTTANSTGAGSLSDKLTNLQDGDTVTFNIPGTGPFRINTPVGGHPYITANNVTIDGYSQPGSAPNTNSILSTNSAKIQIVLDSRNGNTTLMNFPGDTPNDDTGYGDGESAILGIIAATNVSVQGLCLIGVPLTGAAQDVSVYGVSFAKGGNGHISGCRIGVDVDGTSGFGYGPADALTGFRYRGRDEANVVTNTILVSGVTFGVGKYSSNPRAEFNVITGVPAIPIIIEGENTRISGNFINVYPDGKRDYNASLDPAIPAIGAFEGNIEIGRGGNNTVIGVDGDGVNDAEERNVFSGVLNDLYTTTGNGYGHNIEFYGQSPGTNIVVAGNYIGVGIDGTTRFTNSVPALNAAGGTAQYRFGSDFDGVSDNVEGNVIYNNFPPSLIPASNWDPTQAIVPTSQLNFFDELSTGASVSARGNVLVDNFPYPVSPTKTDAGNVGAFLTNYMAKALADANNGVVPVLSSNSSTALLVGTVPVPSTNYPTVMVDVYRPDVEGMTNGMAANIPELPDGFVQGKVYLGSFAVTSSDGSFSADIRSFGVSAGDVVTITANYSKQPARTHNAETVTSAFAAPVSLTLPAVLTITHSGNSVTVSWPAAATGFTLESSPSLTTPNWTAVGGVVNNSVTVTIGAGNQFYRLRK